MQSIFRSFIILLVLFPSGSMFLSADDWPHWRGPTRNGKSSEASGFQNGKWPLVKAWQTKLGEGSSSPIIVGNSVYSFYFADGEEILDCRDTSSGKVQWTQSYSAPKYGRLATGDQGLFSGPCSTPEFDTSSNWIYTLGSDGDLICWNTKLKGKQIWRKSLYEEYDIPRRPKVGRSGLRDYGFTSSPLLVGEMLVVEVGSKTGNLIAFDKKSGKELWRSESQASAGHNGGPVLIRVDNIQCVAVHNHDGLLVVRTDQGNEGKTVAQVDWITSFANNVATVAVIDNRVILTSAYNQNRIACFEISLKGARKIWEQKHASKICTPVITGGKVYFCWRSIKCLDLKTGNLEWEGESTGDAGSIIHTHDEKLIVWAKKGELKLIDSFSASPSKLNVLANVKVFSQTDAWPHVVLADSKIFCKDRKGNLQCFSIQ